MKKFLLPLGLLCAFAPSAHAGMGLINHYNRHWAGPMGCIAGSSFAAVGLATIARAAAQVQYPEDLFSSSKAGIGAAAILSGTVLLWYSINRLTRETALDALEKAEKVSESLNGKYQNPIAFMLRPTSADLANIYQGILSQEHGTLEKQALALNNSVEEATNQKHHLAKFQNEILHYRSSDQNKFESTKIAIRSLAYNLPYLRNWSQRTQQLNNAASWNSINKEAIKNALQRYATVKEIADITKISPEDTQATYWKLANALNQLWPDSATESAMFGDMTCHITALQDPINVNVLDTIRSGLVTSLQDIRTRLIELQTFKNDFLSWRAVAASYNDIMHYYSSVLHLGASNNDAKLIATSLIANVQTDYHYPIVSLLEVLEKNMLVLQSNIGTLSHLADRQQIVPVLFQESTALLQKNQELKKALGQLKAILLLHPDVSRQIEEKRHQDYNKELKQINGQLTEVRTQYTTLSSTVATQRIELERKVTDSEHAARDYTDEKNAVMDRRVTQLDQSYGYVSNKVLTLEKSSTNLEKSNTVIEQNIITLWDKVFPKKQENRY